MQRHPVPCKPIDFWSGVIGANGERLLVRREVVLHFFTDKHATHPLKKRQRRLAVGAQISGVAKAPQRGSSHRPDAPIPVRQKYGSTRLPQVRQRARAALDAVSMWGSLPLLLACRRLLEL